jgi:endonuclease/exonuclease/phosphatase family metal-dependent hydrolase
MNKENGLYSALCLNVWGGIVGDPLLAFLERAGEYDVLWLQEVPNGTDDRTDFSRKQRRRLFEEVSGLLPGHHGYFAPVESGVWGLAMFLKRDTVEVLDHGLHFVHRWESALVEQDAATVGRAVQWARVRLGGRVCNLLNFHGLWSPDGKGDTPDRLEQSQNLIRFVRTLAAPYLLAGDFNYLPGNECFRMLVDTLQLTDHVAANGITSTRTHLYKKPDKYADYLLTPPGIEVRDFGVLPDDVSDHAALRWRFALR